MPWKTTSLLWASLAVLGVVVAADPARGQSAEFRRGDSNADGSTDISDAVFTLRYLFLAGMEVSCKDAADSNDDGVVDISDPVALLWSLFLGAGRLPPPSARCGLDPTPDGLGCGKGC